MKYILFFLVATISLQADLYDRNKYNMDFRPEDQPHHEFEGHGGVHPNDHSHQNCPCFPDDPQCPCEIDANGNYRRVD
jgi:hypothetical protein